MGVSTSPAQICQHHSTPSHKFEDVTVCLQDSKRPADKDTSLSFTLAQHTRHNTLLSHTLSRGNLALTLSRMC